MKDAKNGIGKVLVVLSVGLFVGRYLINFLDNMYKVITTRISYIATLGNQKVQSGINEIGREEHKKESYLSAEFPITNSLNGISSGSGQGSYTGNAEQDIARAVETLANYGIYLDMPDDIDDLSDGEDYGM